MTAQKYLDELVETCKIYSNKSNEYREVYAKLFPDINSENDVRQRVAKMNDEELYEYFKSSQLVLAIQMIFNKTASFIYFCKNIDVELNIEGLNDVNGLMNFVLNYVPFNSEYTISEGDIKEKNKKEFDKKFQEFKKSIGVVINMV